MLWIYLFKWFLNHSLKLKHKFAITYQTIAFEIVTVELRIQMHMSYRLWTHLVMAYVFTGWTCFVLFKEYKTIAAMRLQFQSNDHRHPEQFTVRNCWFVKYKLYLHKNNIVNQPKLFLFGDWDNFSLDP